jgi:hypothetical protein
MHDTSYGITIVTSLSHLIINYGNFISVGRTRISAPSLITLELDDFKGYTPLLEPMPSLIRAFLRFGENCHDHCDSGNYFGDCGSQLCGGCSYSKYYGNDDCVLLEGLSGTKNLELISQSELVCLHFSTSLCSLPSGTTVLPITFFFTFQITLLLLPVLTLNY